MGNWSEPTYVANCWFVAVQQHRLTSHLRVETSIAVQRNRSRVRTYDTRSNGVDKSMGQHDTDDR